MSESGPARIISDFLDLLRSAGGLSFDYTIKVSEAAEPVKPEASSASEDPSAPARLIEVDLSGPDTPLILERNGELLHAIESLTASVLRLTPEQQDQLSFDAGGYKASRVRAVAEAAEQAIATVRSTSRPFAFPPMNSRERRMLHLALVPSGLATASSGLGPRRFVVLYPEGQTPTPERFDPPTRPSGGYQRNRANYPSRASSSNSLRGRETFRSQPSPQPISRQPEPPALEEDAGNRSTHAGASAEAEDPAATAARLESIRRAFRKR